MITTVEQLRDNLIPVAENTALFGGVVNIVTAKGNVVLLSEEEYRGVMETLRLNAIPGMSASIVTGLNTPLSECIPEEEVDF